MKIQIIDEKENPMLKRRELVVSIDYEGGSTISKADLQKSLAEQLNANIENVEVSKILSEIGLTRGKAWIKIWKEKKVPIYSEIKKEKKKPVKKPPEKKPEKPKPEIEEEKPKEEPKPEEKPEPQPKQVKEKEPEKKEETKPTEEAKEEKSEK
jgi:ribosomal protein S24E